LFLLNAIRLADCKLVRLTSETEIKPFDCGNSDLNDFLFEDSKPFLYELLAVTYLYEYGDKTVCFFSVSNDKISHDEAFSKQTWNVFRSMFPDGKRIRGYPAVKVGRLGVDKEYKAMKFGTGLLDAIKISFLNSNKTGCRFITVDAYNEITNFYEKNGFRFLTETDAEKKTRLMYFDLARMAAAANRNILATPS
jgi:hypothetical protein